LQEVTILISLRFRPLMNPTRSGSANHQYKAPHSSPVLAGWTRAAVIQFSSTRTANSALAARCQVRLVRQDPPARPDQLALLERQEQTGLTEPMEQLDPPDQRVQRVRPAPRVQLGQPV